MRHCANQPFLSGENEAISNATSQNNIIVLFSTFTLLGSLKKSFKQEEEEEEKGRSVGVIVPPSFLLFCLPCFSSPFCGKTEEEEGSKNKGDLFFLPSSNRGFPRESRPVVGVALWLWFSVLCSEYTCGFPHCGKENIALVRFESKPGREAKKSSFVLVSCDIPSS